MRIYGYEDRSKMPVDRRGDINPGDVWVEEGVGFESDSWGAWLVSYTVESDPWAPALWTPQSDRTGDYGWTRVMRVL